MSELNEKIEESENFSNKDYVLKKVSEQGSLLDLASDNLNQIKKLYITP